MTRQIGTGRMHLKSSTTRSPSAGITEGELGFRGQVCFHGTSEPAIQSIVQVMPMPSLYSHNAQRWCN